MRVRARAGAVLLSLVAAALVPAVASADSIVYLRSGDVWIAQADGTGARQFTGGGTWAWPSEADDGTVVAVGGLARINPDGTDSGGDSELYRFAGNGTQLGNPIPTWGSYSTPACPTTGPYSAQVSPDGSKIAYGIHECGDNTETALWTPYTATGLQFPNQSLGQSDYYEPSWVDSTHFVVSHAGDTFGSQARWYVHDVATTDHQGVGWYEPGITASGAQAVISRDGKHMAVFTDDAAGWLDGKPRKVQIWLYRSSYPSYPGVGQAWDYQCPDSASGTPISLDASAIPEPRFLSPSFSPDGTKLLWADTSGVELAAVPTTTDCSGFHPTLLIPGGAEPFYAKGNLQAAATVVTVAPGTNTNNGGTTTTTQTTPTTTTTTTTTTTIDTTTTLVPKAAFKWLGKHLTTRRKVVFDAGASNEPGGKIVSYRWSFGDRGKATGRKVAHRFRKAKAYKVTLTVSDKVGTTAKVTRTVRIKRH